MQNHLIDPVGKQIGKGANAKLLVITNMLLTMGSI